MKKPNPAIVRAVFKSAGLPPYVTEHHFSKSVEYIDKKGKPRRRLWRFDYAWLDAKVALEVEGAIFMAGGGRHNRGGGMKTDMLKYNTAILLGWRILRVMPEQLLKEQTTNMISLALTLCDKCQR